MLGCQALPWEPQGPVATSSSVMVTVAVAGAPRVAPPVGELRVTKKVSGPSTRVSLMIGTVKDLGEASPFSQASVPFTAW